MTELERDHVYRSRSLHEAQRRGVHAVAEAGGFRAIVEDVPEVGVAFGAGNRRASYPQSRVTDLGYVFFGDGSPEAGPSGTGVEFGGGVEERIVAADATVDAFVVKVPVFPGIGDFSVGVAGNVEDSGAELLAPLIGRLDDLGDANLFQAVSVVGERDDGDVSGFRECSGRSIQYRGTLPLPNYKARNGCDRSCEEHATLHVGWRGSRALLGRTASGGCPHMSWFAV